jgi:hypothetical protein
MILAERVSSQQIIHFITYIRKEKKNLAGTNSSLNKTYIW